MSDLETVDLSLYRQQMNAEISDLSATFGEPENQAFLEWALNKLTASGELDEPVDCFVNKTWKSNKKIIINGYSFDDADQSLAIYVSDYADLTDDQPMTDHGIEVLVQRMENFVLACYDDSLKDYCDALEELVQTSAIIGGRLRQKFLDQEILRLKFYVITNRRFSSRIHAAKMEDICGKDTSVVIWGLDRFASLDQSGKEREPIIIDFCGKYGLTAGIQCIEALVSGTDEYEAYLCIIPGKTLAQIYSDHGSELLEQNVRAFLGEKSKYNKGIINTIKKEPDRFFIYNNGIAVTGKKVNFASKDGQRFISQIEDMQIINGGQTTASLYSQYRLDPDCLNDIFVPMKLTILKKDDGYDEVVSNISRFSNSQTKVSDADFFSAHPFHVTFESLSKRVPAPAKDGEIRDTYWFYERARGKYNQQTFNSTNAQIKEFQRKFPPKQRIKKEDLAKFYMTGICKPYDVAKGRAKCMTVFAPLIDDLYKSDNDHTKINVQFFKECISYAIMFIETDEMVAKEPWYKTGGYKNVIVPYSISRVLSDSPAGYSVDLDRVWKKQTMYQSLRNMIELVAKKANDFFAASPNNMLPTEYAKKEVAWNAFKEVPVTYSKEYLEDLASAQMIKDAEKEESRNEKKDASVNHLTAIYSFETNYWLRLIKEGYEQHLLTSKEADLLMLASKCNSPKPPYLTDKQADGIWQIREKLGNEGIII